MILETEMLKLRPFQSDDVKAIASYPKPDFIRFLLAKVGIQHVSASPAQSTQWLGTAMVLGSAAGFATLAIFAKLAYASGLGTEQALAFRFLLAAIGMWILAMVIGQNPLRLHRHQIITLVALGGIVYTAQSLTYFVALRTLPASMVVLIAYIYPSLVVVAGWMFLRRSVSQWHWVALAASFGGVALLVGGTRFEFSWGLVLAIASPTISSAPPSPYISAVSIIG